jgi:hypothetical protein
MTSGWSAFSESNNRRPANESRASEEGPGETSCSPIPLEVLTTALCQPAMDDNSDDMIALGESSLSS